MKDYFKGLFCLFINCVNSHCSSDSYSSCCSNTSINFGLLTRFGFQSTLSPSASRSRLYSFPKHKRNNHCAN